MKLRWQCRRGMLELDLILLPFFDTVYETLPVQHQGAFQELLTHPDQDLYEWLLGKSEPKSNSLKSIIALIRERQWKK